MARTAVSTRQLACNYVELATVSDVIWYYLPRSSGGSVSIFAIGFVGLATSPVTAVIADAVARAAHL